MQEIEFQRLVESGNLKELRFVSESDASKFVIAAMERHDREAAPVNFDRLMSMGILLANTGHENVDDGVLRWLLDEPSSKRLDIAAAFLNGLWQRVRRRAPVTEDKLDMLVTARCGLEVDDDAEFSFIQALCQVIESDAAPSVKLKASESLKNAARRDFASSLWPSVTALVERTLKHR